MILWFFGAYLLSSLFILGSFMKIAWAHRRPFSVFNATLMLAFFLDLHALAFALTSVMRINDIWSGRALDSESALTLVFLYALLLAAKMGLVWVAALEGGRKYDKRIWWGFWASLVGWTLFCL